MKSKKMWITWHNEGEYSGYYHPSGLFETALEGMRTIDKRYPLNREQWPRVERWWTPANRESMWHRKDGWLIERFNIGVLRRRVYRMTYKTKT